MQACIRMAALSTTEEAHPNNPRMRAPHKLYCKNTNFDSSNAHGPSFQNVSRLRSSLRPNTSSPPPRTIKKEAWSRAITVGPRFTKVLLRFTGLGCKLLPVKSERKKMAKQNAPPIFTCADVPQRSTHSTAPLKAALLSL